MTALRARRLFAWIALWAILLGALAPTASRALAAARGGQSMWVEVCSAAGTHWVQVRDDGTAIERGSAPAAIQIDHCPLCVLASDRLAPPSTGVAPLPALAVAQTPPAFIVTVAPVAPLRAALARGPPPAPLLFFLAA
ncbi:DUF2946 domain-containing protein [Ottowia testudinis]|uniref:DUF2946 domain-containing protein n=1 Tax=Ottowia testudinis TaxID=2816950 RepID=A0A975CG20_9BURK|nr:DUF2946 domain-containing protein [Ottowia testudinis]QTD45132.1 DUF2946 domain-containing protein [Ottowia testudinis]